MYSALSVVKKVERMVLAINEGESPVTDDWKRPDGWAPRGSCLAISAHLSDREAGTAPPR